MTFRQVRQRGFEAYDDGTPLVVVDVETELELSVAEVVAAIDDTGVELADRLGLDIGDDEYAKLVGAIIQDAAVTGRVHERNEGDLPAGVAEDVRRAGSALAPDAPDAVTTRALSAWVTLFGSVSFELFGQLNQVVLHRDEFFAHQMRAQARFIGL